VIFIGTKISKKVRNEILESKNLKYVIIDNDIGKITLKVVENQLKE
jgi:hypothetical protein